MPNYDTLKFDTEQIATISTQTLHHQADWDAIWNKVRTHLSHTAAEALSKEPGGSLDHRSAEYHRKTQLYTDNLQVQSRQVGKVGHIATETNTNMTHAIRGA